MPIAFSKVVRPIDFSALSGQEFERLVFATLLRMRAWHSLSWHGQSGADGGRDIVGVCDDAGGRRATVVVACANWRTFTLAKAKGDIDKLMRTLGSPPDEVILVAGSSVSAAIKGKIAAHAHAKGIHESRTWSGAEFEEHLRFHAASVLDRFFSGVELPEDEQSLKDFVHKLDPATAEEAASMLGRLFRRPAFTTAIRGESSLPAFRQAIGDTIGALNTGIWRDREGAIISRVPSIASFSNTSVVAGLERCVERLVTLRAAFDEGIRTGRIRPCGCGDPDCPVFMVHDDIQASIEEVRASAIAHAESALKALRTEGP